MRADLDHWSVLRCGCPVAERGNVSTRALHAARVKVKQMLRNRKLRVARGSSQLRARGSLRALNARVRLGVFFSGVLLGSY
jgi:hypothetical protein